ncbi:hypothetical protein REPUB_Repub02eG0249900 [Reevesia pubescens]
MHCRVGYAMIKLGLQTGIIPRGTGFPVLAGACTCTTSVPLACSPDLCLCLNVHRRVNLAVSAACASVYIRSVNSSKGAMQVEIDESKLNGRPALAVQKKQRIPCFLKCLRESNIRLLRSLPRGLP